MNNIENINKRIDELEIHVAHQDKAIDGLSEISITQWSEIKTLQNKLKHLKNKLQDMEDENNNPSDKEALPPHF